MSDFLIFISLIGVSEAIEFAIRELLPNFGKNNLLLVQVNEPRFSGYYRNKTR